jgi:hypothetical protein
VNAALQAYTKLDDGEALIEAVVFHCELSNSPKRVTFKTRKFSWKFEPREDAVDSRYASITVEDLGDPDAIGTRSWIAWAEMLGRPSKEAYILRAMLLLPELRAAYFAQNR